VQADIKAEFISVLRAFVERSMDAPTFVCSYQKLWRMHRDSNELRHFNELTTGAFDRAFTAADCYAPEVRSETPCAIDLERLHSEISEILMVIEASC
jgi:hypothetical protein